MPRPLEDLVGKRFSNFVVLERLANRVCRVICDCGVISETTDVKRAGGHCNACKPRDNARKHGESGTRLHGIWSGMRNRCHVTPHPHYGGRGITVCDEWREDYLAFKTWALANGYADDLTIDRIDNDKGYGPDNCRWATAAEQARNRRCNRLDEVTADEIRVRYSGGQKVAHIARDLNIARQTVSAVVHMATWA